MTTKAKKQGVNPLRNDADVAIAVEITQFSFEEAMTDLEQMIERIESGAVGLEESLQEYERGIELFRHCRAILNQAEQRFEKLRLTEAETGAADDSGASG